MKIGFIGYSGGKFDKDQALKIIYKIFAEISKNYKQPIEIVSGATNMGIPSLVYQVAVSLGYKTVGIMCKEGYDNPLFPVDDLMVEGDNWGDESKTFISMIDVLYRIGGGPQSLNEVEMAKKKGIKVIEYELPRIIDMRSDS